MIYMYKILFIIYKQMVKTHVCNAVVELHRIFELVHTTFTAKM